MTINKLNFSKKVVTLALCVGVLPFLFSRAYAQEPTEQEESKWLDDYHTKIGFTYGTDATLQSAYLWRGLYVGAFNVQGSANVGYGGLYATMWWNIGTTDWAFSTFQPEVDIIVGFSRWGLTLNAVYIHNFDCGFFDFHNYPDKGNNFELGLRYTVSSKLPLSILWATRVTAKDGYIYDGSFTPMFNKGAAIGDTVRAYSTYIELSYKHTFPYDISLYGAIGMTPWRSMYTGYKKEFAVHNIDIRLRKDWSVSERCGLMVMGELMINPSALADDRSTAQWHPQNPGKQSVNANIAFGVYLK